MKRTFAACLGLVLVCGASLTGCGGGIDEGLPPADTKPDVPLDPKMVDMTGRSFADQKKAAAKNITARKEAEAAPPAETKN